MKFAYMPGTHFGAYDQAAPSPEAAADAFEQVIKETVLAEEMGFDGVFLPERHARGESFVSSPLIVATAIAARTSRIRIATTVLMPTLYNPMHLAEQVAMIDNLSRGRFTLGIAVGYRQDYHRFFGVPWEHQGTRFEEALEVPHFAGERFSYAGEFYQYDNVQLPPPPDIPAAASADVDRQHSPAKPLDRALAARGQFLWRA